MVYADLLSPRRHTHHLQPPSSPSNRQWQCTSNGLASPRLSVQRKHQVNKSKRSLQTADGGRHLPPHLPQLTAAQVKACARFPIPRSTPADPSARPRLKAPPSRPRCAQPCRVTESCTCRGICRGAWRGISPGRRRRATARLAHPPSRTGGSHWGSTGPTPPRCHGRGSAHRRHAGPGTAPAPTPSTSLVAAAPFSAPLIARKLIIIARWHCTAAGAALHEKRTRWNLQSSAVDVIDTMCSAGPPMRGPQAWRCKCYRRHRRSACPTCMLPWQRRRGLQTNEFM